MSEHPDRRFPFDTYPTGWFHVAGSDEVATGQLVGLHCFGRHLICYRDSAGTPFVLDGYCPHLGADIGVGGTVVDDCIVCPFHGWRFNNAGRNVAIPYADTVNRTARLRAWPTAELAGGIFVWYSTQPGEPQWQLPHIPELDNPQFVRHAPESARWRFRSHPQDVFENTVDIAHFATVHGVAGFGKVDIDHDEHTFQALAEVNFQTPREPVAGAVQSQLWGMGIDVIRQRGLGDACTLFTVTPVDGELVDARYTFLLPIDPDTGQITRMGHGLVRDFCKQAEQDITIWENKIYRQRPQLARGEHAITEFRAWARRSYEHHTTPCADHPVA